jgi:hypothetical protein
MSFRKCIDDLESSQQLTKEQAKEARDLFEDLAEEYRGKMGNPFADEKAAQDAFNSLRNQKIRAKRNKIAQMRAWQEISFNMDQYRDRLGRADPFAAAMSLFEQDGMSTFSSATQRIEAIKGQSFAEMSQVLATFRRNLVGEVRQKAKLKNMAREIFGESTGDSSAREMAEAWNKTAESLRKRYNRAGGNIPKRQDWGLPQRHDTLKVRKASYTQWRDSILPKLDTNKMIDEMTGLPFSPERLEVALRDVYETISTDGLNKLKPGAGRNSKMMANRRQDHRFLAFKNADAWLEYQREFGDDNVFDVMVSHIDAMSRDIGLMEIFGPNPGATVNFIKQTLTKKTMDNPDWETRAARTNKRIDELYAAITGSSNAPISSNFAATMAGTRQVLQSAQLGAAAISAITDLNFQRMARQFSGLPQTTMLKQYLDLVSPLSATEKGELAIRLGLIAEGWTSLAAGQARFVGDISGPEVTRRIADFVMRASLLSPMTNAGRWAFGMEFLGTMADNSGKAFKDLDPNFRGTLERYGISESRWDIIRSTELYDEKGAKFLRPSDIADRTDVPESLREDLATRVLEMVNTETNFAVPSNSLRGRTYITGETQPGTLIGELARSVAMYKNFGVTLVNTHLMRGMQQKTTASKGSYYANLIISTTLMGALAMQLKEMSKGRDPREMFGDSEDTAKFWFAAFMQGGGLGIFGDFLNSNESRTGSSLGETIVGPVVGLAGDVRELTVGNLYQAATGDDTNFAAEMIKFTQRYAPGSSLWYSRLAMERMLFDQLTLMADPNAKSKMRRVETKYKNEFGQRYWWAPGDTEPERAPDIGAAFGR